MVPGIIISILTFPGVIVHELAHQLFCRWLKVAVFEVCYFQASDPVGYVLHEHPNKAYKSILISIGPFFINTVIGCFIAFPAALSYKLQTMGLLDYLLFYLGVSIAMHAFPSTGDAESLWKSTFKNPDCPLLVKIISTPIVGIIYVGAFGSFFWLDLFYGIAVAVGLPWLLLSVFV